MRQPACLVIDPNMIDSHVFLRLHDAWSRFGLNGGANLTKDTGLAHCKKKLLVSFALTGSVYIFCPESQFSLITPVLIH